jgi:hypothetical protein
MKHFAFAIILIGSLAYIPSFQGIFFLDDFRSINPEALGTAKDALTKGYFPLTHGRPLLMLSFWANYKISGMNIWSYHVVNLLIHLCAGLVLFGIIRRTLKLVDYAEGESKWLAFLSAMMWTVHPLNTQAVSYIVQRGESLMGLLFLLTVYFLILGAMSMKKVWLFMAICMCGLAMTTKEVAITLPFMVLLYDRTFLGGALRTFKGALVRRWWFYATLLATCAWPIYVCCSTPAAYGSGFTGACGITTWQYAATEPGVLLHYLRMVVLPFGQCFDPNWQLTGWGWQAWAIGAMVLATVLLLWKRPAAGFLGAWFFGILSVTSSVYVTLDPCFEHRMYLPLAAVIVALVLAAYCFWRHFALQLTPDYEAKWRLAGTHGMLAIIMLLAFCTWNRLGIYSNELDLYFDCVKGAPWSARAHNNLGLAMMHTGHLPDAENELHESLKCDPNYPFALINMGNVLIAQNKATPWALNNDLGLKLLSQGHVVDAFNLFISATHLDPGYWAAWHNAGRCAQIMGHIADAKVFYQRSQTLNPKFQDNATCLASLEKLR